jgi:hypothetical protein
MKRLHLILLAATVVTGYTGVALYKTFAQDKCSESSKVLDECVGRVMTIGVSQRGVRDPHGLANLTLWSCLGESEPVLKCNLSQYPDLNHDKWIEMYRIWLVEKSVAYIRAYWG